MRRVSVEIPWDEVREARKRMMGDVARKTTVPGFRRGKAPATVLNRYFEREIIASLTDGLVMHHLAKAVERHGLAVAHGPMIDGLRLVEGRPLVVSARFEVFPDFELGEYRKLPVAYPLLEVTDDMVEDQLQQLRYRHRSYRNIDPRPIRDGDSVTVLIEGTSGGKEPEFEKSEERVEVGHPDTVSGFSDALRGLSPGESTEFDITFPEEGVTESLVGKKVHFRAEIQGISEIELPDLDDEFAKDVENSLDSLEDLRAALRHRLQVSSEQRAVEMAQRDAIRQLAESHPMPLPPKYMERRIQEANSASDKPEAQSANQERYRAMAEMMVRSDLVLDRIADVENLTVSNSEIDAEILRYARARQITPQSARKELEEKGAVAAWSRRRRRGKALQFVIDEAERVALVHVVPHDHDHPEGAEGAE